MVPKTKVRILQTALKLYNEHGVYNPHGEQITARRIAAELNMSDGNLRYHFPSREDIVRGLYDELVEKLNTEFSTFSVDTADWSV
ncbi:MAG: TetR/AcrR family transcriptional regulator, partial [Bacteroidia bacterium]|nr:TetR/AcrR family transcriptional regulator [Bacteroidia bacterium]